MGNIFSSNAAAQSPAIKFNGSGVNGGQTGFINAVNPTPYQLSSISPTPTTPEYTYTTLVVMVPNRPNLEPSYTTITTLIPVTTVATFRPVVSTHYPVSTVVTLSASLYTTQIGPAPSDNELDVPAETPFPTIRPAREPPRNRGDDNSNNNNNRRGGSRGSRGQNDRDEDVEDDDGDLNIFDYDAMIEDYYSAHPNPTPMPVNTITSIERYCPEQYGPCRFLPSTTTIWHQEE